MSKWVHPHLRELGLHCVNTGDSHCDSALISQRTYTPNEAMEKGKLKNKSDFSVELQGRKDLFKMIFQIKTNK